MDRLDLCMRARAFRGTRRARRDGRPGSKQMTLTQPRTFAKRIALLVNWGLGAENFPELTGINKSGAGWGTAAEITRRCSKMPLEDVDRALAVERSTLKMYENRLSPSPSHRIYVALYTERVSRLEFRRLELYRAAGLPLVS